MINNYDLSVIVIMYNMRREAERTLYSLTKKYLQKMDGISYEVIVLDNGSTEPLDAKSVQALGENFHYEYFDAKTPSPCAALNHGVQIARGKLVSLCIDGARILSPGTLYYTMLASKIYENPFIYTLAMHIGSRMQNYLARGNYSWKDEDKLIATVDWQKDGYLLFDISSVAGSSGTGYFSQIRESNCMTIQRSTYQAIGGYDERFTGAGGGLANLDFFNRLNAMDDVTPILILGEATFHQFHGGIATNVSLKDHPWKQMAAEYKSILGKEYEICFKPPVFFGKPHSKCRKLLVLPQRKPWSYI